MIFYTKGDALLEDGLYYLESEDSENMVTTHFKRREKLLEDHTLSVKSIPS